MAFSLLGASALAGTAVAQPPTVRPSPTTYNVTVTRWPGKTKEASPPTQMQPFPAAAAVTRTPTPATMPAFASPPAPPPMVPIARPPWMAPAMPPQEPIRTLYYQKDQHEAVRVAPAAQLTPPMVQGPIRPALPSVVTPVAPPVPCLAPKITDVVAYSHELESEARLVARANAERRKNTPNGDKVEEIVFPDHSRATKDCVFPGRFFADRTIEVEPNFVCFRRLLFEDKNTERYGWTGGPLQPLFSAGAFWGSVQWTPYKLAAFPCLRHDSSAGLCLPGDPVPMMIYPPGLSAFGGLVQAGVVVAGHFIIP